jgi:hypothetical protein
VDDSDEELAGPAAGSVRNPMPPARTVGLAAGPHGALPTCEVTYFENSQPIASWQVTAGGHFRGFRTKAD